MDKYEIEQVIDEGTYGIVSKAVARATGKLVAIKEFKEDIQDPLVRKALQREIKMLKDLRCQFVVNFIEAYKNADKIFFVFEYMPMNMLKVIEQHENRMSPELFRKLALKMLQGLRAIHSKGAVHRDVKPENILTDEEGSIKYCDFGFTRYLPGKDEAAMTDYVATRWYRSPELLVGQPYRQEVDVWALGCIFCEMLDGVPIFHGDNDLDQLHQIQKKLGDITAEQKQYLLQTGIGEPLSVGQLPDFLADNYLERIGPDGVEMLKGSLTIDPRQRLTVDELLQLPYFKERLAASVSERSLKKGLRKKNCGILYSDYKSGIVQEKYIAHKLLQFRKPSLDDLHLDLRKVKDESHSMRRIEHRFRVNKMVGCSPEPVPHAALQSLRHHPRGAGAIGRARRKTARHPQRQGGQAPPPPQVPLQAALAPEGRLQPHSQGRRLITLSFTNQARPHALKLELLRQQQLPQLAVLPAKLLDVGLLLDGTLDNPLQLLLLSVEQLLKPLAV